jgi:hypothetical protein
MPHIRSKPAVEENIVVLGNWITVKRSFSFLQEIGQIFFI